MFPSRAALSLSLLYSKGKKSPLVSFVKQMEEVRHRATHEVLLFFPLPHEIMIML